MDINLNRLFVSLDFISCGYRHSASAAAAAAAAAAAVAVAEELINWQTQDRAGLSSNNKHGDDRTLSKLEINQRKR